MTTSYGRVVVEVGDSAILQDHFIGSLESLRIAEGAVKVLQIGAGDGRRHDPIFRYLKMHSDASAVFIEPMHEYFRMLLDNYREKLGSVFLNFAVTPLGGEQVIHFVDPAAVEDGMVPPWAFGISSITPDRNALRGRKISREKYAEIKPFLRTRGIFSVSCEALVSSGLDRGANVLVCDCEGMDAEILLAMPKSFQPSVIRLEWMLLTDDEKTALSRHLSTDYDMRTDGIDLVAVRRNPSKAVG